MCYRSGLQSLNRRPDTTKYLCGLGFLKIRQCLHLLISLLKLATNARRNVVHSTTNCYPEVGCCDLIDYSTRSLLWSYWIFNSIVVVIFTSWQKKIKFSKFNALAQCSIALANRNTPLRSGNKTLKKNSIF